METYQPINKSTSSVTDAFIPCPFQKKKSTLILNKAHAEKTVNRP